MNRKKSWKGSYTVEAAAVVSITFLVLASLVIGAFYVHDRAVLQSLVCEIAAAGSCFSEEDDRSDAVAAVKEQITASRFLGSRELSGNVSSGAAEVSVEWSASYPVPGFAMNYLAEGELAVTASWSSQIVDPAGFVRLIRGAGELLTIGDD
ncbi:MAG: hypothetical protein LUH07_12440 [Lachnospiraceae bacterium]|nr:hypothetical protein [Lachnospiraceae bacterium]